MKMICPNCKRQYDGTWKICIKCNVELIEEGMSKLPQEVLTELNALKALSASIDTRLKNLERKIGSFDQEAGQVPVLEVEREKETVVQKSEEAGIEEKDSSFETKIGRIWFNRIGVLAIFLGAAFFLKYAFDNNWIGPLGRVVMGLIAGLGMIIIGEYTHRKNYKIFSEGLLAGGTAILYLSVYAAVNFYHLIDALSGFTFMAIVTLFASTFAIRFDSPRVIGFTIIGGFLTPFLMFTEGVDPVLLLSYILVLDIGILWVSYFKKWEFCNLFALIFTYLTYFSWYAGKYKHDNFLIAEIFITSYFVLFSMLAILYNFIRRKQTTAPDSAVIILNGIFYFIANYSLLTAEKVWLSHIGFLAIAMAIGYLIFSHSAFLRTQGKDKNLILTYLSMTILFATLSIPMELKYQWATIGFIVEFALLIWLGFKVENRGLRLAGLGLAVFALIKLLFFDFTQFSYSDIAQKKNLAPLYLIFNKRFFTYLVLTAGGFVSAYLYKKHKKETSKNEKNIATILALTAAFILLFNLSLELDSYFDKLNMLKYNAAQGPYKAKIPDFQNIKQFSLSVLWAVYSFLLIIIGINRKFRALRIMALILFIGTILKVFLIDVSAISRIWRILSFIGLGLVLVITSFIYQKYKNKISGLLGKD